MIHVDIEQAESCGGEREREMNVESSLKYERSKYAFVYDKEPRNIQYRH